MNRALLIIGHGSKSEAAVRTFHQIVEHTRAISAYAAVAGACMELSPPTIEQAVAEIASRHIDEIVVVPYFLYEGTHIRQDIPAKIRKVEEQYPAIQFRLARPIGFEPLMSELILKRAEEVI